MKKSILTYFFLLSAVAVSAAEQFVYFTKQKSQLAIVESGKPLDIYVPESEDKAVHIAAKTLSEDFQRVCGTAATVVNSGSASTHYIIIGTADDKEISALLTTNQKKALQGKWEKFIITAKDDKLLIAGSDRRGCVYGIYELSKQMGVSPWYWWADVPVTHQDYVAVKGGEFTDGEPAVQYRGIFINDEWPCTGNWAQQKFGGFNSKLYEKYFELILRLKGNYMWPAMWSAAFYDDDKRNGQLAHDMGVVMGTSHHEPLAQNQQDWKRRGKGEWDFTKNEKGLTDFWTEGVERSKNFETFYTIGMRGDGDLPMDGSGNVKLMEQIVKAQRDIIGKTTGRKVETVPQMWALYKEVQDYYDQGMKVADDITLLLCDDNWGNVRRLPNLDEKPRKGGYGMYYHFDYVGAPRNSKWMSINPIPRVWEQLSLTYSYGVKKVWIVNVGDLKLQEYPIQFFMDMAWRPEDFNANNLLQHTEKYYAEIFGEKHSKEIARIMSKLWKHNRIVTPEQLTTNTFSFAYNEWQRVVAALDELALSATAIRKEIEADALDSYDQLVYIPVSMVANMYDMYYAHAKNLQLYKDGNPECNSWADLVKECFQKDAVFTKMYHKLNGGKWNHHMDQMHIGYKGWNEDKQNNMPAVKTLEEETEAEISVPAAEPLTFDVAEPAGGYVFKETDKVVSMEAAHTSRRTEGKNVSWLEIPDFGKTLSGMTSWPQTADPSEMLLEYDFEATSKGNAHVVLLFAPTLNYNDNKGLRYTVSIDGLNEKTVNINQNYRGELGQWQKDPIIESRTIHNITPGKHTLKVRFLDPGMVLERIHINLGGLKKSHLGAPETLVGINTHKEIEAVKIKNQKAGIVNSSKNLKELFASNILVGAAVNQWQVEAGLGLTMPNDINATEAEVDILPYHFNSITAENCMKSEVINPSEGVFDFTLSDQFVKYGMQHKMSVIGHSPIWHSQIAKWICRDQKTGKLVSPETLKKRIRDHIFNVYRRYKGQVKGWDVANEAIEDDGSYRNSDLYKILGEEWVDWSFQCAMEADPETELYYNDYSMDKPAKRAAVVALVKRLKSKGLRIDAVGMQTHIGMTYPSFKEFEASVDAFIAAGVKVQFTEVEMSILPNPYTGADVSKRFEYTAEKDPYRNGVPAEKLQEWKERFYKLFDIINRHADNVLRVTFWGVSDETSWKNDYPIPGRTDYPLPFNREGKLKFQ